MFVRVKPAMIKVGWSCEGSAPAASLSIRTIEVIAIGGVVCLSIEARGRT